MSPLSTSKATLEIGAYTGAEAVFADMRDARRRTARPDTRRSLSADFRESAGLASLTLKQVNKELWDDWKVLWEVNYTRTLPLRLDIRASVSRVDIDLSELKVNDLELTMKVSQGVLYLPEAAGDVTVDVDMDVSNLEIVIPPGLPTRVRPDINIAVLQIDRERFVQAGGDYVSPGFDGAANRVTLNILCDIGRVAVR